MRNIRADRITIRPDETTHLYIRNKAALTGEAAMYYFDLYAMWQGQASVDLAADVQAAGEYQVALCCSVPGKPAAVRVTAGKSEVAGTVAKTWGVWTGEDKRDYNFERVTLPGALRLREGPVTISVHATTGKKPKSLNVSSIELTPVRAQKALAAREAAALTERPSPAWFSQLGYGLMFHWQPGRSDLKGQTKPYEQMVNDFDVRRWADMVEDTGARYVFITANHGEPHFPAPLKFWEKIHPGWTTRRDLLAEMSYELERRSMRMCAYLNCPTFASLSTCRSMERYVDLCCRMFQEVGEHYGPHLGAYWLDSFYQPYIKWGHLDIHTILKAARAGCKDRMIAFNHWAFPVPTQAQDFWAGEVFQTIGAAPDRKHYRSEDGAQFAAGAGKGILYHALYSPDCNWGCGKIENGKIVDNPIWKAEMFGGHIKQCVQRGAAVTLNLGCLMDGSIAPQTVRWMRKIRKIVRGD
ncbi:MAG: alpha-L-fucosidase [Phycisphaerae bacterium]